MFDIIFGGITGLVGTMWSGYNKRKEQENERLLQKDRFSHELHMVKAESEAMLAEAKANIAITEAQVQGAVELEEVHAFTESQAQGNKQSLDTSFASKLVGVTGWARFITMPLMSLVAFLLGLADAVKGLLRPAITLYLLGVSTWISTKAWGILTMTQQDITSIQAIGIVDQSISALLYLTTTTVTWWFGDRMTEKNTRKLFKSQG